jgi:hypothetical protein
MSALVLLKRGGQFMLSWSPGPTAFAVALSVHLQEEVGLVAAFPGKVLYEELWDRPIGVWFPGDEKEVLTSVVTALYDIDPTSSEEEGADVWSMLEKCSKEEADTASAVKTALYKKFGKRQVRPILRSELKETTVKLNGAFRKVIRDQDKNCIRLRS